MEIPSVGRDERIGSTFNYLFSVIYQTENISGGHVCGILIMLRFFIRFFLLR